MLTRYAQYAVIGVVLLILVIFFYGTDFKSATAGKEIGISGMVMALASASGLLQIVVFLGYGLVNVPKHFLINSNPEDQFKFALFSIDQSD